MICKVCNVEMRVITNTHLARHGLTTTQYREQFGELSKRLISLKTAEALIPFGLGEYPDPVVAGRSGVTRRNVALARARLGIPVVAGLYKTQEGKSCRSIVEAQFDAWLHDCDIDHEHHPRVPNIKSLRYADFQIGEIFIEIIGMMGFARYESRWAKKRGEYEAAGVPWIGFYPDQVESLYALSSTKIICVERRCSSCKTLLIHSFEGECRNCHRKTWGKKNGTIAQCDNCGDEYLREAGSKTGKFCTLKCYWESLRDQRLPSDEDLVIELQSTTAPKLAEKYGVKANTINMRARRARKKAA